MKRFSIFSLAVLLCVGFFATAQAQDTCPLCQFAVQYIDGYLQQNYTQAQIIKQLEVVCALSPFRVECDSFVATYTPLLINYITKYEDPKNACAQLRLCSSSFPSKPHTTAFKPASNGHSTSGDFCSTCTSAVTRVLDHLKQTGDLPAAKAYLDLMCSFTLVAAECVKMVDATTSIAELFIEFADPKVVCQDLFGCQY